jgi:hypothetical protein
MRLLLIVQTTHVAAPACEAVVDLNNGPGPARITQLISAKQAGKSPARIGAHDPLDALDSR